MTTQGENEKRFDPGDTTLKFVDRPDDLDPYSDGPRAEMSCGHAVTPESLTGYCRNKLDEFQFEFKCPALKAGTDQKCNAEWSYQEVRRLALLTPEEMQHFEENISRLAAEKYREFQECPGCKTYVERKNLTNLCVQCTLCTAKKKTRYWFCWQCLRPWKGPAPRSDRCDNDGCINDILELLEKCEMTNLPDVKGVSACPSIRACPTCGIKVAHDRTRCKNIICTRCRVEFCFLCLKRTTECLKTSTHFKPCSDGVAPRQTSIPVWHRK